MFEIPILARIYAHTGFPVQESCRQGNPPILGVDCTVTGLRTCRGKGQEAENRTYWVSREVSPVLWACAYVIISMFPDSIFL